MRLPRKSPHPPITGEQEKGRQPAGILFRFPHYWGLGGLLLLVALSSASVCADPPKAALPPKVTATVPAAIPDYGGRDSAPLTVSDAAPNPLSQAGRALEALLIVLAGVVGVVYGLKRFGLVTPGTDGKPARIALPAGQNRSRSAASPQSPVTVISSQTLPGGTLLHVVEVAGRTLLLAATGQTVTAVAEWPAEPETSEKTAVFEDYLARAETHPDSAIAAANARLRSLLARPQTEEPS